MNVKGDRKRGAKMTSGFWRGNLLKRTQKDEQFGGEIMNLNSDNLRLRSLTEYPTGTPKESFRVA